MQGSYREVVDPSKLTWPEPIKEVPAGLKSMIQPRERVQGAMTRPFSTTNGGH
jgi:hypothetical protein